MLHDPTTSHDILAACARWYERAKRNRFHWRMRRMWNGLCYAGRLVQTDRPKGYNAGSAHMNGPAAIGTLDAFVDSLSGIDPGGPGAQRRTSIATLLPGEVAMAMDFIETALAEASETRNTQRRRDARAWLQDRFPMYSARLCFEALGGDYDAIRSELVQKWAKEQA